MSTPKEGQRYVPPLSAPRTYPPLHGMERVPTPTRTNQYLIVTIGYLIVIAIIIVVVITIGVLPHSRACIFRCLFLFLSSFAFLSRSPSE